MPAEAHGGLSLLELRATGVDPAALIDFSVNVNPYGPSPCVLAALREFNPAAYPDPDALQLREALAAANSVPVEQVLAGNGSAELIWLAAQACVRPGGRVLIVGPAFGEYARAARAAGGAIVELCAEPPAFGLDAGRIVNCIREQQPRLTYVCNPNNPTGLRLSDDQIHAVASACAPGLLVLDEAYRAFVSEAPFGPPPAPNVLVLRSMTKDYALAGLRVGYALAQPSLLESLRSLQPPWSVSGAAQAAGLAALGDPDHLDRTLALTRQAAAGLRANLEALGARLVPSTAHFLLIEVDNGRDWRRRLMARGCLVRDCASFGLPQYVRAGTRTPEENEHLITAWRETQTVA
jgi:threonine-phosphate decarboxylase